LAEAASEWLPDLRSPPDPMAVLSEATHSLVQGLVDIRATSDLDARARPGRSGSTTPKEFAAMPRRSTGR
jgi:hypothetical protein